MTKLNELPSTTAATGSDLILIQQGGADKQITKETLFTTTTSTGTQTMATALDDRVVRVGSVADLASVTPADNLQFSVGEFWPDTNVGGGLFTWDASRSKTDHNGGTVIDPDKLAQLGAVGVFGAYFTAAGTGAGVFVRKNKPYILPEDFGCVAAGTVADNSEPANKALSLAEKTIFAGGAYHSSGKLSFYASAEFIDSRIKVSVSADNEEIVEVLPTYTTTTLAQVDVVIGEFVKYTKKIPSLSSYPYHYAVIESNDTSLIRTNGTPQTKKTVTVVGIDGELAYPLTETFTSISSITLTPINIPFISIENLFIEADSLFSFALPVSVNRNNVNITNLGYKDAGATQAIPVRNLVTGRSVFGLVVNGIYSDSASKTREDFNYTLNLDECAGVSMLNLTSSEGWANLDGNYCRDVTLRDSRVHRVGGHFGCYDYTFENLVSNTIGAIAISGGGRLDVSNIACYPAESGDVNAIVNIRQDYGAEWDGDIKIAGCSVDTSHLDEALTIYALSEYVDSASVSHDFGRNILFAKSIIIEDVSVSLNQAATLATRLNTALVGASGTLAGARKIRYPSVVSIEDANILSDKKSLNNQNTPFYLNGTTPSASVGKLILSVRDCHRKDPRDAGLNPYDGGQQTSVAVAAITDLTVMANIDNCEWVRTDFSGQGVCKILNSSVAAIAGSGRYELYGDQYYATSFSGSWKALLAGGVIRAYLATDSTYKQVGFPNNIEDNLAACRELFVEVNGSVRSLTQTTSTVQTGFYDAAFYITP